MSWWGHRIPLQATRHVDGEDEDVFDSLSTLIRKMPGSAELAQNPSSVRGLMKGPRTMSCRPASARIGTCEVV
jgi:hypothetical protein